MTKNITLRIEENLLRTCRHFAVEEDKSLSRWVVDQLKQIASHHDTYSLAKKRALKRMEKGFSLGGILLV